MNAARALVWAPVMLWFYTDIWTWERAVRAGYWLGLVVVLAAVLAIASVLALTLMSLLSMLAMMLAAFVLTLVSAVAALAAATAALLLAAARGLPFAVVVLSSRALPRSRRQRYLEPALWELGETARIRARWGYALRVAAGTPATATTLWRVELASSRVAVTTTGEEVTIATLSGWLELLAALRSARADLRHRLRTAATDLVERLARARGRVWSTWRQVQDWTRSGPESYVAGSGVGGSRGGAGKRRVTVAVALAVVVLLFVVLPFVRHLLG
jgi:hypothetical protein